MMRSEGGGDIALTNQLQTKNATIIEIMVMTPEMLEKGTAEFFYGTARRDPADAPADTIGYKLALGRALRTAARSLLKEANEEVREREKQKQRHLQASRDAKVERERRRAEREAQSATRSFGEVAAAALREAREILHKPTSSTY